MRHLPNALTISRLACVPILFWLADRGSNRAFAVVLFYALLSDVLDGMIARRYQLQSPLGGVLDSIADAVLLLTVPLAAFRLYPTLREHETATVATIFVAYLVPILLGALRFRRLTSYHTIGARIAGWVLAIAFFALVAWQVVWPLHIAMWVVVASQLEEVLITWRLPAWRANVPSVFHALR